MTDTPERDRRIVYRLRSRTGLDELSRTLRGMQADDADPVKLKIMHRFGTSFNATLMAGPAWWTLQRLEPAGTEVDDRAVTHVTATDNLPDRDDPSAGFMYIRDATSMLTGRRVGSGPHSLMRIALAGPFVWSYRD